MAKMSESQLMVALAPFNAVIKGWGSCSKADLDIKVKKAWVEINRLKAENGPWKKAKSDVGPVMQRWMSMGGLPSEIETDQKAA